jgi:hypothetical protein
LYKRDSLDRLDVVIGDTSVAIKIVSGQIPANTSARTIPLSIVMDGRHYLPAKEWKDRPGESLEEQLTVIIRACLVRGEEIYRLSMAEALAYAEKAASDELAAAEAMAEKARTDELERQREEKRRRQVRLLAQADAWKQAMYLREYVAARKAAIGLATPAGWEEWALSVADSLDPLISDQDLSKVEASR